MKLSGGKTYSGYLNAPKLPTRCRTSLTVPLRTPSASLTQLFSSKTSPTGLPSNDGGPKTTPQTNQFISQIKDIAARHPSLGTASQPLSLCIGKRSKRTELDHFLRKRVQRYRTTNKPLLETSLIMKSSMMSQRAMSCSDILHRPYHFMPNS